MMRGNPEICRQNQERFHLLGQVCRVLGGWADGDRRYREPDSDPCSCAELREPVVSMPREKHKRHTP